MGFYDCKYYIRRIDTIRAYIGCLYRMHDGAFCTGGLLHIVTDDGNLEDHNIWWCLEECNKHPEREDSEIGKLICNELLKLNIEQRRLVYYGDAVVGIFCDSYGECKQCPICNEEDFYCR